MYPQDRNFTSSERKTSAYLFTSKLTFLKLFYSYYNIWKLNYQLRVHLLLAYYTYIKKYIYNIVCALKRIFCLLKCTEIIEILQILLR